MLTKLKQIRQQLEMEKSNSNKFMLSSLYCSLLDCLTGEEVKEELSHNNGMELLLKDYEFYDYLINDNQLYKNFYEKTEKKYQENEFKLYDLYSENSLKLKEAKEIVYGILDSINVEKLESYKELYCFDKIKLEDLNQALGMCYNTFGHFEPIIYIDKKINKQVPFIITLVHGLGHEYENMFMKNMSIAQQIDRYVFCFTEVMSQFFERVALEYLIKNNIYKDDAQRELNLDYFSLYDKVENLYSLSSQAEQNQLAYDEENIIENAKYVINEEDNAKQVIVTYYNYMNDIKYSYGYLLAEYFFDIYIQDKKDGLKQIKNFLADQALLDERDMLEKIDFLNSDYDFLNQGLRENMVYMRKRYKW